MENLSHSFSKRSYGGNGFGTASHKSVYDDVFGGPPKFGMPTLAPRLEDYSEIFGGFHSARGASIPILDLPVVDEAELGFDVRSSRFDYSEVFGGFNGLDFALSFDDFVRKSNGRDDSSDADDAWSPAESESPSSYTDPSAFSDRSQSLINEDTHHPTSGIEQLDTSYNKTKPRSNEKMSNLATHVAQLHAIPGNTHPFEENYSSKKVEVPIARAASDLKSNIGFDGGTAEEQKTIFLPVKFGFTRQESDCRHVEKSSERGFSQNKPFVTVNDINLRTKPSQLPPPSRPPPLCAENMGASAKLNSKQKYARSCSFEEAEDNSSQAFYDVEIDGNSSMFASATMKDAMEKGQAKIKSPKEIEKKEVLRDCSKLQPQTYVKTEEETVSKTFESISSYKDERKVKCAKESSGTVPSTEERSKVFKMDQKVSDLVEKERYNDFAERSTKGRDGREHGLPHQISHKSAQAFAWRKETEYFEVVEAVIPLKAVEQHEDDIELVQKGSDEFRNWVANEAFEQKEEVKDFKIAKESPKLDEKKNKVEVTADCYGDRMRSGTVNDSGCDIVFQKVAKVDLTSCESDMNKEKIKMVNEHEKIKRLQDDSEKSGENQTKADMNVPEANHNPRGISEQTGNCKMLSDAFARKTNERKPRENLEMEECDARLREDIEQEKSKKKEIIVDERKKQEEYHEKEKNKKWHKEVCERKENENMSKEDLELEDNEKGPIEHKEHDNNSEKSFEKQENKKSQELGASAMTFLEVDIEESFTATNASRNRTACGHQELSQHAKDAEEIKKEGKSRTEKVDQVTHLTTERESIKAFDGADKLNNDSYSAPLSGKLDKSFGKLEATQAATSRGEDEDLKSRSKESELGIDIRVASCLMEERPHSVNQNEFQHEECENGTVDVMNSRSFHQHKSDSNEADIGNGHSSVRLDKEVSERPFEPDHVEVKAYEQGQTMKKTNQLTFSHEISKDNLTSHQPCVELSENGKVTEAALPAVLGDREAQLNSGKKCIQNVEGKDKILNDTLARENNRIEERLQKERELEMEHVRKLEEEREREREREKDRMAVDRAALETRNRLYVEARERAERAAVERATAGVRQRTMAEAREKLEKSSMEARERSLADKASMEARLKAERAAVERATLEARQRAFEKAMADRFSSEGRERVERSVSDKFFTSSRTDEMRQSSSFSNSGTLNPLRYSYSSVHVGSESESPQRCKARLERYRRTAERAAKALEEKNLRDLVAQREQAERNRLAETLGAEVKRWSSGKEGNLRALLSTLQYILGPESGWQPIPLTEVITSAAVKKAYRKATLCVHPDKLQQRGASIQQKYICEKVFDLLKEAWNIFNSEER